MQIPVGVDAERQAIDGPRSVDVYLSDEQRMRVLSNGGQISGPRTHEQFDIGVEGGYNRVGGPHYDDGDVHVADDDGPRAARSMP